MKSKLPISLRLDLYIILSSPAPTSIWPKPQCQHEPSETSQ